MAQSTSITVTINFQPPHPVVVVDAIPITTQTRTLTLQGTCTDTIYLKVNASGANYFVFPENDTWSFDVPYLLKGLNTFAITAYNKWYASTPLTASTTLVEVLATDTKRVTPMVMTPEGLRPRHPMVLINGRPRPVRVSMGIGSATAVLTGVGGTLSAGVITPLPKDATALLSGVSGTLEAGSIIGRLPVSIQLPTEWVVTAGIWQTASAEPYWNTTQYNALMYKSLYLEPGSYWFSISVKKFDVDNIVQLFFNDNALTITLTNELKTVNIDCTISTAGVYQMGLRNKSSNLFVSVINPLLLN